MPRILKWIRRLLLLGLVLCVLAALYVAGLFWYASGNLPSLESIQHNAVLHKRYHELLDRGKPKMTAVVACMRQLLCILNQMMRNNEIWNPKFA